ncbi:unnamed protein product [Calypogeia fissa]
MLYSTLFYRPGTTAAGIAWHGPDPCLPARLQKAKSGRLPGYGILRARGASCAFRSRGAAATMDEEMLRIFSDSTGLVVGDASEDSSA